MITIREKVRRRILEIKRERNFTQADFAEAVGLSENAIGKIERGDSVPTLETVEKITKGLNIPLKIFFDFDELPKQNIKEIKKLSSYLQTKSKEDIVLVRELAETVLERKKIT